MIDPQIKITELDDRTSVKSRGDSIDGAPQPEMTAPVSTAWATSGGTATHLDASNSTRLDNMYTRLNEIEDALVRLGLINSR